MWGIPNYKTICLKKRAFQNKKICFIVLYGLPWVVYRNKMRAVNRLQKIQTTQIQPYNPCFETSKKTKKDLSIFRYI